MNKEILKERARKMQLNPTVCERIFAERLEMAQISFRNQVVIGIYIVDFLIGNIIIEIDGKNHHEFEQEVWDLGRDKFLKDKGYTVIRVMNADVRKVSLKKFKDKPKWNRHRWPKFENISSGNPKFKTLSWNNQKVILQRERLYGK